MGRLRKADEERKVVWSVRLLPSTIAGLVRIAGHIGVTPSEYADFLLIEGIARDIGRAQKPHPPPVVVIRVRPVTAPKTTDSKARRDP